MSYYGQYRGDYSTYGYGQGDPGWLSSLWKGVKRIAAPIIGGMIAGPAGAAMGAQLTRPKPRVATPPIVAQQIQRQGTFAIGPMRVSSQQMYPPVPQFAGQTMSRQNLGRMTTVGTDGTGCCPRGFHLAKDGSGRCVRNRRMNVANPRALRRSMRRVQGFEKLARRTISFTRRVKMKK